MPPIRVARPAHCLPNPPIPALGKRGLVSAAPEARAGVGGGGEGGSGGAGSGSGKELRLQPEWSGCQPRSRRGRGAILRPSAVAAEPWPRPTVRLVVRGGGGLGPWRMRMWKWGGAFWPVGGVFALRGRTKWVWG